MTDPLVPSLDTEKLSAARLHAVSLQPFLASALYALVPTPAPGLGTFAVDRKFPMSVDPEVLERWSIPEVAGVLLHEAGHVVRDHGGRALHHAVNDAAARRRWNIAADAEINDDLVAAHIWLPPVPVVPATLGEPNGKVVEYYFDRLSRRDVPLPPIFNVDCGAGAHGIDGGPASIDDTVVGLESFDVLLIRARVAAAIRSHAAASPPSIGQGPTLGWRRWADQQLDPQLDWRQMLRTAVRAGLAVTTGLEQPTYRKPGRRRQPRIILPALTRPLPAVAVIIDTSGSMDDDMLAVAYAEVRSCLGQLSVRRDLLTLYAVDMVARKISAKDLRNHALPGGGGTDLRAGFQAALHGRPRPHLIIALTDGLTPWPDKQPPVRAVAALLPTALAAPPPPSWVRPSGWPSAAAAKPLVCSDDIGSGVLRPRRPQAVAGRGSPRSVGHRARAGPGPVEDRRSRPPRHGPRRRLLVDHGLLRGAASPARPRRVLLP